MTKNTKALEALDRIEANKYRYGAATAGGDPIYPNRNDDIETIRAALQCQKNDENLTQVGSRVKSDNTHENVSCASEKPYKCQRCKDTGRWGWDESPDMYECDHTVVDAVIPWTQSQAVDVEALKLAVKEQIDCLVYDTCHSLSQPSMKGMTWGKIEEYQQEHINKAVLSKIDHLAAQGYLRQPLPEIEGDISDVAKDILKKVVGLTFNSDTASITMTPESFMRCIREAHSELTKPPQAGDEG